jgi:glyoxylase-like metal-dependent hydrolase (beta-lactamase superfamily II)
MQLFSIMGNSQRLDGGAMYGNAPKALWARWSPPDEENRIELACRALLIRDGDRLILAETGIGAYMEPALKRRFGVVEPGHVLIDSLERVGVDPDAITHVVLSHLHFDHAGGLLAAWREGEAPRLLFRNALYLVGDRAFERAEHPHARDRASFIPGLNELLQASGRLHRITGPDDHPLGERYRFRFSDGHTPGLTHLEILEPRRVVFASDLIPGTPWVHLPITMGYDRYPELLIDEKRALLETLAAEDGYLFYTHDPRCALSRVARDAQGRFSAIDPVERLEGWSAAGGT